MEQYELYIVSAEITAKEDSEILKKDEGAFLFAFVLETDADLAGAKVRKALEEDNFDVDQIEEIILEEHFEWEDQDKEVIDECIAEAKETNDVVYGPFFAFEEDK